MNSRDRQIAKLYRTGLSMEAVGREVGVCETTVYRTLIRLRIPRRPPGGRCKVDPRAVLATYKAGASILDTARQHGTSTHTVGRIVGEAGVTRPGGHPPRLPLEEIARRYNAGETTLAIAAAVGGSERGIRKVLDRAGVARRSTGYRSRPG